MQTQKKRLDLRWLAEAKKDVARLRRFLRKESDFVISQVSMSIVNAAERLIEHPYIGVEMSDKSGRRELITRLGRSGYVIRYRVEKGTVVIIRVWHTREQRQ